MSRAPAPHQCIVAIDPGLTGAIAWLELGKDEETLTLLHVEDVPTYLKKSGTSAKPHLDLSALSRCLHDPRFNPTLAVIEEVGAAPGQGVTSMFRFGYVAGALAGVCACAGLDVTLMRPQHWQKWARKRPGKGAARERAIELFPSKLHLFKRAKDHNRAEAALIGYAFFVEAIQKVPKTF